MELYDEIHRIARDYISDKRQRSTWKKRKIKEAYELLTGNKINISCSTCYIEALLTIVNNTKMATPNFELKKGVVLQAFGEPKKTCTNDTITDELGEWYLTHYPEKIIFFSKVPAKFHKGTPPSIKVVNSPDNQPQEEIDKVKSDLPPEVDKETDLAAEALRSAMGGTVDSPPPGETGDTEEKKTPSYKTPSKKYSVKTSSKSKK